MSNQAVPWLAAEGGDQTAAKAAYAFLYDELRRMAHAKLRRCGSALTLQTTALVHESYLRLRGVAGLDFPDRARCLAYASQVMRTVIVDLVRAQQSQRRGGQCLQLTLNTDVADSVPQQDEDILRVHEALQALALAEPRLAQVVEMRYFGGLPEADIAQALNITVRTVQRDWQKARLFLLSELAA